VYGVTVACLTALLVAILLRPDGAGTAVEARVLLEVVVPLPLLLVSAGLLQADPALGLVAVKPVRLGGLLLARWTLALAISMAAPIAVHVVTAFLDPGAVLNVLIWLAPMLFLSAIALAFAAVGASTSIGVGVAIAYWAVSLFLAPVLQRSCSEASGDVCVAAVWSTAYGLLARGGAGWSVNRALLLVVAVLLTLLAVRAYRYPERHVKSASSSEVSA